MSARAVLRRLHPNNWWSESTVARQLHARWHAIKVAFSPLDEHAIESIYNAGYFQYAIDQARQTGRAEGADFLRRMLKYQSPEESIDALKDSVRVVRELNDTQWKSRTGIYHRY